ncbi:uncharacterized protein EV154DRAFT_150541 [Mucor mucedo]|uniref:Uncharacterized protein n=1 Tax=Mucor saturninus TaxID=64648 RepID=A0A8H7RB55_9FUNG|nr:uncharacterized protein EV154DRAFT_150541 [Mucor mucedo]KAG2207513.1 hypothetical protein INT47_004263 [Mucor saturninus]KAI7893378.1 hypothetical protein EV154DRAFT_150541 [Mucor mucedo]
MGLFSWFSTTDSTSVEGLDNGIPQKTQCYHIEGFLTCSYFTNAVQMGDRLSAKHPNVKVDVSAYIREQWSERSRELQQEFETNHGTSPFIYEGCDINNQNMIGGYTDFAEKIKATYKMD